MQYIVAQPFKDDNSIAQINATAMEEFGLAQGDVIKLKSMNHRFTMSVAMIDEQETEKVIKINGSVRRNLGVELGDRIEIEPFPQIRYLDEAHILPFEDASPDPQESLLQDYLIPYFQDEYRPITEGDSFIIKGKNESSIEVKVVFCWPKIGIMTSATVLSIDGPAVHRQLKQQ